MTSQNLYKKRKLRPYATEDRLNDIELRLKDLEALLMQLYCPNDVIYPTLSDLLEKLSKYD